MSKLSVATFILSAAAVLFLVAMVLIDPQRVPVAEVTKTMDASWASPLSGPQAGDYLYKNDKIRRLESGLVEITFNYGATVVLEGPCEFFCKSEGTLYLESGRVFAHVVPEATGFAVETPISRIIDLGTEFGVKIETDGSLSTQVFKGKTRVVSDRQGGTVSSEVIETGHARKVDARTGQIHAEMFNETGYVRSFDPKSENVWRGGQINLADIVGGGNGFGTGKPQHGIEIERTAFSPVLPHAFVDGVFVPEQKQSAPVISSTGLEFKDCPAVAGAYYGPITNGIAGLASGVMAQGTMYGGSGAAAIFMHSNSGITFDLEKIRQAYPHLQIQKLTLEMGLYDLPNSTFPDTGKADLWVLIDGEPSNNRKRFAGDELENLSIDIPGDARFLTLVVTDGGPNESGIRAFHNDRCVFGRPFLHLVPRSGDDFGNKF